MREKVDINLFTQAAFEIFSEKLTPYKAPIFEKGQINNELGEIMKSSREEAINSFDKSASRYNQGVYQKKRAEMWTKLNTLLGGYFVGQLSNLHKKATLMFDENLHAQLKKPGYNFAQVVADCLKEATGFFVNGAKGTYISE